MRKASLFPAIFAFVLAVCVISVALPTGLSAQQRLSFIRDAEIEDPEPDDLYRVGTVVMVMRILRMSDGRVKVLVRRPEHVFAHRLSYGHRGYG